MDKKHIPYKLTLHTRLRKLPHEDYEIAMKWFPKALGIHPKSFHRWIYQREDNKFQVPATAIIKMADFFGCTPAEMFTTPPSQTQLNLEWESFKEKHSIHV